MSAVAGLRVLVVEDEPLVSMMLEMMLEEIGAEMTASAANVATALDVAAQGGFDCAILDVNLGRDKSFPVAELLSSNGVPFIFASGLGRSDLDGQFPQVPVVDKPFMVGDLETGLSEAIASPAN